MIEECNVKIKDLTLTKNQKQNDLDTEKLKREKFNKEATEELNKLIAELQSVKNDKETAIKKNIGMLLTLERKKQRKHLKKNLKDMNKKEKRQKQSSKN